MSEPSRPWLFGYGSLIWRPDFPFIEARPAHLAGWQRRFWQASTDHRGTPARPGRVVTLVPAAAARCTGRAFRLDDAEFDRVFDALDVREQLGYERQFADVELNDGRCVRSVFYLATRDNAHFLGPAPLAQMAGQVIAAHGPSGSNTEYVLRLAEALGHMNAVDPHVSELAAAVAAQAGRERRPD